MIKTRPTETARASGFTLLEMMITVVVLVTVMFSMGLTGQKATDAIAEKTFSEHLIGSLHRAMDRIIDPLDELELADLPPLEDGTQALQYHLPTGWVGGIQWDADEQLALEYDPAELDDGIDNDGDGLVDECQVVLTRDLGGVGEQRVVICRNVAEYLEGETLNGLDDNGNLLDDERGFFVDVQVDVLTVRLTLERMSAHGLVQETATSSVRVRN